jgi:hypothetical protein
MMKFKSKLLLTSFVVLSLQEVYATNRPLDEDWDKDKKSYNQSSKSNLAVIETEKLK